MKENKIRKIILGVLAIAFIISAFWGISVRGADIKSKISKQVSIGRELVNKAEKGNGNGQYSEYTVKHFSDQVEGAAAVMTDMDVSAEVQKQALSQVKEDIEAFKKAENKGSLSGDEIQKLMDEKGVREEIKEAGSLSLTWRLEGEKLQKAESLNLDVGTEGLWTETLKEQVAGSYGIENPEIFSLRHDGDFPGIATVILGGDFEKDGEYLVCRYDEKTDALTEYPAKAEGEGKISVILEAGGDYAVFSAQPVSRDKAGQADGETQADNRSAKTETTAAGNETADKKEISGREEYTQREIEEGEAPEDSREERRYGQGSGTNAENPAKAPEPEKNPEPTKAPEPEKKPESTKAPEPTKAPEEKIRTCTIEIRCDTVLSNMDNLTEGLEAYVPGNGVILAVSEMELYEGETVFDVLKRATRDTGIKMEFRNDGVHGSGYIVGLNHLNEFDCGSGSGWMYTVNGWFPNYGCAKYVVEDGDVIRWLYTCDLGRDIGGNYWE